MVKIRKAKLEDLNQITEIYNEAILTTNATFDTKPKTHKEQEIWFRDHGPKNPIIVAEQKGAIIGWASLSKWSDRCAYSDTVELSVYVREKHQRKGTGKKLIEAIIEEGEKINLHTAIARITEGNNSSINLHKSLGFFHIGVMKEVGFKFGKRLDVFVMQKIFNSDKK